jgi:hypothetical protein
VSVDPRSFLPRTKRDFENARRIVALGYPAVAPVLPELFEWIQDGNWPIAPAIAAFLTSIGEPIFPQIREVLRSNDGTWKYWCITWVIGKLPPELAEEFGPELEQLAFHPTRDDQLEELDQQAKEVLDRLNGSAHMNSGSSHGNRD